LGWRAPVMKDVLAFCAACRAGEFSPLHAEVPSRMVGERK
jgi:hypothetical protein